MGLYSGHRKANYKVSTMEYRLVERKERHLELLKESVQENLKGENLVESKASLTDL